MWGQGATLRLGETPPALQSDLPQAPIYSTCTIPNPTTIRIVCKCFTNTIQPFNTIQTLYKGYTNSHKYTPCPLGEAWPAIDPCSSSHATQGYQLYKYFTNTIQILYKYYTNTIQILYKYCTNTVQILYKYRA